ncbi:MULTISPECIES: regulatory protein RecX [unclassified Microbacterium]|uniref:regulatory protein RecX n=1 Tax=unclassified Microbacterium TaxID=2609290 RepID=UPI00214AF374|nr:MULTISPECIES: regulatory protein RecX [unclassified Microbacterium]MCR2810014.1 recombination regulator RecX [Microbacterium sp. zg.B185]WIM20145.1 regulatory protein RecX [Microbacterium sp. zg-B185]
MVSREGDGGERLAPVTYLPGAAPTEAAPVRWTIPLEPIAGEHDDAAEPSVDGGDEEPSAGDAESLLTRRLRRSALSEREARSFLAQRGVEPGIVEATIERFTGLGWIDDAVLAEQLLYAGTSRKGQGRRAIAQTLSTRGIARDVADAALAALPDDDDERALEYARSKANGLRSYDMDTATRRLMGQLARRGYSGSVAANAVRTALTEQRGGVQFR